MGGATTWSQLSQAQTLGPVGRAAAQSSGPPEGREVAPGVRRVDYSKRATMIPNYKTVSMRDTIYQPGASTSGSAVTVRNTSYNGSLAANASTTFGYIGTGSPSTPTLTVTTP